MEQTIFFIVQSENRTGQGRTMKSKNARVIRSFILGTIAGLLFVTLFPATNISEPVADSDLVEHSIISQSPSTSPNIPEQRIKREKSITEFPKKVNKLPESTSSPTRSPIKTSSPTLSPVASTPEKHTETIDVLDDLFDESNKNIKGFGHTEINPLAPTNHPTLAPTIDDCKFEMEKPDKIKRPVEIPKFYIMEELGSSEVLQCFRETLGFTKEKLEFTLEELQRNENLETSLIPYISDIFLLQSFKDNPHRTYNISEAEVLILDFLPTLSYFLDSQCGESSHKERVSDVFLSLNGRREVLEFRTIFFSLSYPIGTKLAEKMLGSNLFHLFFYSGLNSFVATTNNNIYVRKRAEASHNSILVPLMTSPAGIIETKKERCLYFDEVIANTAQSRVLKKLIKDLKEVFSFRGLKYHLKLEKYKTDLLHRRDYMLQGSKYCLIINNIDNVQSGNRLSEAVSNDCSPIVLEMDKINLPLEYSLTWENVGEYFTSLQCIEPRTSHIAQLIADNCQDQMKELSDLRKLKYPDSASFVDVYYKAAQADDELAQASFLIDQLEDSASLYFSSMENKLQESKRSRRTFESKLVTAILQEIQYRA
eukprot:snap_masked-scaffold_7-processed-gene-18.39-mRNA-1 protein AED:1.00 eAED:1.00 QI:0/0/0/0/1/1/2/0/594